MILDLPIRIHNFGADHRFLLTGCWNMDNCLRKMNDSSSKQENKIKKFDPQLMISACGWIFGFTLFSLVFSSWFCHLFPSHVLLVSCILLEKEKINHTNHGPENQIILEKECYPGVVRQKISLVVTLGTTPNGLTAMSFSFLRSVNPPSAGQ